MRYKRKAYIKTTDGFKPITSKYICTMSYVDQGIYVYNNKPFYLEPSADGPGLTFDRRKKTFVFYGNRGQNKQFYGSSEDSATHTYCIEEIAKLNRLSVKLKKDFANRREGDIITFTFNYIFSEIVLKVDDAYIKPDLLIYIREPHDLALRWNRLLAIEIVVTNPPNGKKLQIMKNAKIPILKIKANKKWGKKKEEEMSEKEKQELRSWIKNTFKGEPYTSEGLLDTKSKVILENKTINKLEANNEKLTNQLKESLMLLSNHKKKYDNLKDIHSEIKDDKEYLLEELKNIKLELVNIEDHNRELFKDSKKLKKRALNFIFGLIILFLIESLIIYYYLF